MRTWPGALTLIVSVGVLFATAPPGMAIIDITYRCLTDTEVGGATRQKTALTLPPGSDVVVVLGHFCMGYCGATAILKDATQFNAYTPKHISRGVKLPPDRIVQHDSGMNWFHAVNGDPEQMIEIQMTCKIGSGLI